MPMNSEALKNLSPGAIAVLRIVALKLMPASAGDIEDWGHKYKGERGGQPDFNVAKVKSHLESLCDLGLLEPVRDKGTGTKLFSFPEGKRLDFVEASLAAEPERMAALIRAGEKRFPNFRQDIVDPYRTHRIDLAGLAVFGGGGEGLARGWAAAEFQPGELLSAGGVHVWFVLVAAVLRWCQRAAGGRALPKGFLAAAKRVLEAYVARNAGDPGDLVELLGVAGAPVADLRALVALLKGGPAALGDPTPDPGAKGRGYLDAVLAMASLLAGDEDAARATMDRYLAARGGSKGEAFADFPLFPLQALWYLARGWAAPSKLASWVKAFRPEDSSAAVSLWAMGRNLGRADSGRGYNRDYSKRFQGANSILDALVSCIAAGWAGAATKEDGRLLGKMAGDYASAGFHWLELEALSRGKPGAGARAEKLRTLTGIARCVAELLTPEEEWAVKLKLLEGLAAAQPGPVEGGERLAWSFDPENATVEPMLQRRLKNGAWSAPKPFPRARLAARDLPAGDPRDLPAVNAFLRLDGRQYWLDPYAPLPLLAGHSAVILAEHPEVAVELAREDVELRVVGKGAGYEFSFSHDPGRTKPTLLKTGPAAWTVICPGEVARKVAAIVGKKLVVPAEAKERTVEALNRLSRLVRVASPLLAEHRDAVRVAADPRLILHLVPAGPGIVASVHVRPLGDVGPCFRPGEGDAAVVAVRDGAPLTALRDLAAERGQFAALPALLPSLAEQLDAGLEAEFDDPLDCLELLAGIREAGDALRVEWPKGGRYAVRARATAGDAMFGLKAAGDWFEARGAIDLGGGRTLELLRLLELLAQARGRFIPLGEGDFLELEARFMRQLELLAALGEVKGDALRLPRMAVAASQALLDPAIARGGDAVTEEFRARARAAFAEEPRVPEGFLAELRPYQAEGYRWLARLAAIGAGACLADDMGLGKTVQCLALICARAAEGPALVLAPASVCHNWMEEIARFAPRLEAVALGAEDREAAVAAMGPGKVLVASYGLAVNEAERLAALRWGVMVLDEAHVIKNRATKRFKSVLSIGAAVRIAATGTPLQNNLGELWPLFQFLNPGYLGSLRSFRDRFVAPIQEGDDAAARRALREALRPFLLRRTKGQVLAELPGKTEITLSVEMGEAERAFYEALRIEALRELRREDGRDEQKRRFIALAHLTRLRRACCHPSLVAGAEGAATGPSAKMQALEELLEELGENGHRALVFSQFVDHLALIRAMLEGKGVAYEYLDGSTPQAERAAAVARFQAGGAELFLISLKAGGVGLNLTGADYVIHMDPWWNPAIEDQASDRAHRIGQTKPVTVYRLVAKDSVEEKIVALHAAKRELSDALLEGAELASALGVDEVVAIIAGERA